MGESIINVTPWKINGCNLKITKFERKNHLNQTSIFGVQNFHFPESMFMAGQPTPPNVPPPNDKALLNPYLFLGGVC